MEPPWNIGFTLEVAAMSQGDISGVIPREMALGMRAVHPEEEASGSLMVCLGYLRAGLQKTREFRCLD